MLTNKKNTFNREIKREGNIEDYYIIEENEILGKGASAVVRKGIKIETGEAFAIKIINKSVLTQDEKESLNNELKIMGMVDHPNIVRVEEIIINMNEENINIIDKDQKYDVGIEKEEIKQSYDEKKINKNNKNEI